MRQRRWLIIASAFILVAIAGFVVLERGPLAQPPPPPGDPGMDPAMMGPEGGMGGPPAGGGGAGLEWSTTPSPEDKSMTYQDYCNRTGASPTVPKQFTADENGEDILATKNSWSQLQRVYAGGPVGVATAEVEPGRVGKRLADSAVRHSAYDFQVGMALGKLYAEASNGFTFKVGYPTTNGNYRADGFSTSQIGPSAMSILVIMQVRPGFQKSYGQKVYDRLKKFDCLGYGRSEGGGITTTSSPFVVHTYKKGYYQPHRISLPTLAAPVWSLLWATNEVELNIKNRAGDVIYTARQPAGQGPSILVDILNPPQLYHNPKWKLLIPPEDLRFDGGRLNLNGTRGWSYTFTVDLPPNTAMQMHSASARLVTLAEQALEARIREAAGGGRPAAGAGQAGPGGPGEPGGPEMPPEGAGPAAPPDVGPNGVPPPPM